MWVALEGFVVILALIFLFGIISLPPRAKKERTFADSATAKSNEAAGSTIPAGVVAAVPGVDVQQAALDKSYSSDQKMAAPEAAKVK